MVHTLNPWPWSLAQAGQAFWGVMVGIKKIKQTAVQTTGLLWGLIGACLLIVLGSFWLYHSEQKTLGARLDYLWVFPVFGLLLLCVALYLVQRSMRQGLRLALKDLTDHLPVVVYRYQLLAGHRPHMLYISEAVERLTGSTAQAVMDNPQIFFNAFILTIYLNLLQPIKNPGKLKRIFLWNFGFIRQIIHCIGFMQTLLLLNYQMEKSCTTASLKILPSVN